MPGLLIRIAGPPAAGKSQRAQAMVADGEADLVADTTAIWAAIGAKARDDSGSYPVRADGDLLLPLALYLKTTVARQGLERDLRVVKTSSTPTDLPRDRALASEFGASFREIVVDPGESVVRDRLRGEDGSVSDDCEQAIARFYSPGGALKFDVTGRFPPPRPSRRRR